MNTNTKIDISDLRDQATYLINQTEERELLLFEVQSIFRKALRGASGRNFDGLRTRIQNENDEARLIDLTKQLTALVDSHICYDDKFLTFYLDNTLTSKINSNLNTYFTDPANASNQITRDYQPYRTIQLDTNIVMYQFYILREVSVRQEIAASDLKSNIASQFHNIYGVKRIPLHCFDFIIVDLQDNKIVKGIDLAQVLGKNELNVALNKFNIYLKKIFNDAAIHSSFDVSLDLFPKIQTFYDEIKDKTNGVIEITFTTPAGTAHYEKLRGKATDLRVTTYHKKGVEGVKNEQHNGELLNNDITPYKIGKRYYKDTGNIDISLKSSYQAIHSSNGSHLYQAYVYSCRSYNDLNFAIHKLIT